MRSQNIPMFGPLQGVKVIHMTKSIPGPFTASRLADFGADVIWVEDPNDIDPVRRQTWQASIERRNMRSICIDPRHSDGISALLKLISSADVFIDNYLPAQRESLGIADEKLHELNPGLIIVHVSGFGQDGDSDYYTRPSCDPVIQAFSTYMLHNGFADSQPLTIKPYLSDYFSGLQTAFAITSALCRKAVSGKGEIIDSAQFEAMLAVLSYGIGQHINGIKPPTRNGNNTMHCVLGCFRCSDGADVMLIPVGVGVLARVMSILNLDWTDELPKGSAYALSESESGRMLYKAIVDFCAGHTSAEIDEICSQNAIPCSPLLDYSKAEKHPHYESREVFVEYENTDGKKVRGTNIFPKLKNEKLHIWRGLMNIGEDTADILGELGYSDADIKKLAEEGIAVDLGRKS